MQPANQQGASGGDSIVIDNQPSRFLAPRDAADATRRMFWGLMALHLFTWTIVPALTQPNAPLDTIEMLYWGHEWQWGYYKHPPLAAWVAELSTFLAPNSIWPTYLASQMCVVGCFAAAWAMARETLEPWPALTAALLLQTCYYYNFTTPELNNNILAKVTWAGSVFFLYKAITGRRWPAWVAAGVCLGLALLSKYDAVVLILALLAFSWLHPQARRCWRSPGPYLTMGVAMALFMPHLYWLMKNDFGPIRYFLTRSEGSQRWFGHLVNPVHFAAAQLMAVGPVLGVLYWLVQRRWQLRKADEKQAFQRDYLAAALFGPLFLVLLLSLITGAHLRTMWGSAMWTYIAVFLLLTFQMESSPRTQGRLVRLYLILTIGLALIFGARNVLSPYVLSKPSRVHFPGRPLAEAVADRWQRYHGHPSTLPFVAGTWWVAGNVGFYYPGRVSVYADLSQKKSPWIDPGQMAARGGVILGSQGIDDASFKNWLAQFPRAEELEPITLPWQTGALPPVTFRMAVVGPAPGGTADALQKPGQGISLGTTSGATQ